MVEPVVEDRELWPGMREIRAAAYIDGTFREIRRRITTPQEELPVTARVVRTATYTALELVSERGVIGVDCWARNCQPILLDPGAAPQRESEPRADIIAAIDAATGCQQCGGPLAGSPSDDFCCPEHQQAWHAARSQRLERYEEPSDLAVHVYNQHEGTDPEVTPDPDWSRYAAALGRAIDSARLHTNVPDLLLRRTTEGQCLADQINAATEYVRSRYSDAVRQYVDSASQMLDVPQRLVMGFDPATPDAQPVIYREWNRALSAEELQQAMDEPGTVWSPRGYTPSTVIFDDFSRHAGPVGVDDECE